MGLTTLLLIEGQKNKMVNYGYYYILFSLIYNNMNTLIIFFNI
jgi:hypothetical protein